MMKSIKKKIRGLKLTQGIKGTVISLTHEV